jgi:hypothetical protein
VGASLEERVGQMLSEDIAAPALEEFSDFAQGDYEAALRWLDQNQDGYLGHPDFSTATSGGTGLAQAVCEYAVASWLRLNCPYYPRVVRQAIEELMAALGRIVAIHGHAALDLWAGVQHQLDILNWDADLLIRHRSTDSS